MTLRAEASERLSEEIISSLSSGLLVVGLGGDVQIINPAGRRLLGLSRDEDRGGDYRDLLKDAPPIAVLVEQCLASRHPIVRRSIEITTGGSGTLHLGATVSPLSGEGGEVHGAICLFTDLTAVVALEEQLRLKDSLARVGELTAGIAHEFRNGLATIHGYSRLLDLEALPQTYRPYVEGIRAETDAMRQVITNFLNFARPTQLMLSPVDLRTVADRAADDLRGDARSLNGDIVLEGDFPTVEGDDVLLRQAFSNLLRNAIEACAADGRRPSVSIVSEIEPDAGLCTVSVLDNGPGFSESARDHVFNPFFTTKPHGTGLGLALVQKIVVTHNGRVTAGNSPDGGGCIRIVLPMVTTPQRFAPTSARRP
jgi:PAS domain S-box-containing protein